MLLREELGSSPGAALVALHEQLLRDEPAPAPPVTPPKRTATPSSLVERDREISLLDSLLEDATRGRGPGGADRGPAGHRQVAPDGRVPPPRDRAGRPGAQRARGRARTRVPVRRRPPALRGRRLGPGHAGRRRRARARRVRLARQRHATAATPPSPRCTASTGWRSTSPRSARCCSRSTICTGATARRCAFSPTSSAASRASPCWSPRRCARATHPPTPRCWPRSPTTRPRRTSARARCRCRRSASSSPGGSAPSPTRPSARPATAPPAATRCSSASC